ncbi:FecR domain-containing protein [Chitinophaga pollutisoli]|uniref:FecR domain-containing protein n=1 Tax=Chitinophaga pollutisoli TaxID=3133966 RepID=A0ABZ2YRD7_9BACT
MTEPTTDWGDLPYRTATLLLKQHQGAITTAELQELNTLVDAPARQRLLAELNDFPALEARLQRLARFNSAAAWQQVNDKRIHAHHKRSPRQRFYWAAAAMLTGIAAIAWFLSSRQIENNHARLVPDDRFGHQNDVLPGTSRATLTLSNGQTVQLRGEDFLLEEKDGTRLRSDSGALQYNTLAASGSETLYNTLRVPLAGTYRIVLPDGTAVWLNAASELRFPVRFTGSQRIVSLRGEGYFEVAADAQKPFSVQVEGDTINVLGTAFNISAYQSGRTATTLVSGKVAIAARKGRKALTPGQQAVSTTTALQVSPADMEKATAWKNGYFYFSNESIAEVMQQLTRWYGITVVYESAIDSRMRIGGSISREASLGEVLEQLRLLSGLQFNISGSELKVAAAKKK